MKRARHCGRALKGSRLHLQNLVNDHQEYLNCLILSASASMREFAAEHPEWVSPLKKNDYCEYRDEEFLEKIGSEKHWPKLSEFWPERGPVWDALATVKAKNGAKGVILLEAKSHTSELKGGGCKAKDDASIAKIKSSLETTKQALGVKSEPDWLGEYYQYANRIAHLYFMNVVAQVPTWLVFLYFLGDTRPKKGPETVAGWETILDRVRKKIGLPNHPPLAQRIVTVFAEATP